MCAPRTIGTVVFDRRTRGQAERIQTPKRHVAEEDAHVEAEPSFSQSGIRRALCPRAFCSRHSGHRKRRRRGEYLTVYYVYSASPVEKRDDRTHPRARACTRKATRPRPEYFIFTYQRWALCAFYIKSRYSYGDVNKTGDSSALSAASRLSLPHPSPPAATPGLSFY